MTFEALFKAQEISLIPAKNPNRRSFGFHCGVHICLHARSHVCVRGGGRIASLASLGSLGVRFDWELLTCLRDCIHVCVRRGAPREENV